MFILSKEVHRDLSTSHPNFSLLFMMCTFSCLWAGPANFLCQTTCHSLAMVKIQQEHVGYAM